MGRVWRALDTVLERPVAIKIVEPPRGLDDAERDALRARVLREARAAARIDAPECVRVFDVVDEGDRAYLVMELVRGVTLADAVERDGPMSPAAAAAIGAALVKALTAAHRVGIVHRDVKPRNVMMLDEGGVKLADFGIASLKDDPRITSTGLVLGTPSYMSPEQARGRDTGPATDIWGLGATLYFAVEGVPPFDRTEALPTLNAVLHEPPRAMERAAALAPTLEALLVKEPLQRPSLERVAALLGGLDTSSAPTATPSPPPTPAAAPEDDHFFFAPPPTAPRPVVAEPRPAAAPLATWPPAPTRTSSGGNRRWLAALGAAAAVALVAGVLLTRGGGGGAEQAASTTTAPDLAPTTSLPTSVTTADVPATAPVTTAPTTTAAAAPTATALTTPTTAPAVPAGGRPAGVPADWVSYQHPTVGYQLWHPPSWAPRATTSTATDFRDSTTGDYLRVDYRQPPGPDAVEGWREYAPSFANRHPSYQEITIEPVTFDGEEAALWEFTYEGQHATNLAIVTDETGFALNFQAAEDRWDGRAEVRQAFEDGFQLPG